MLQQLCHNGETRRVQSAVAPQAFTISTGDAAPWLPLLPVCLARHPTDLQLVSLQRAVGTKVAERGSATEGNQYIILMLKSSLSQFSFFQCQKREVLVTKFTKSSGGVKRCEKLKVPQFFCFCWQLRLISSWQKMLSRSALTDTCCRIIPTFWGKLPRSHLRSLGISHMPIYFLTRTWKKNASTVPQNATIPVSSLALSSSDMNLNYHVDLIPKHKCGTHPKSLFSAPCGHLRSISRTNPTQWQPRHCWRNPLS